MKSKKRKPVKPNPKPVVISFLSFALVALAIVVALEFLDHRAGRESFIFGKLIPLAARTASGEHFQGDWTAMLSARKVPFERFRDREGVDHFKIELAEPQYLAVAQELGKLVEKNGGSHSLSEVQGMKERVVYLYQVRFHGRLTHLILLSKRLAPAAAPRPGDAGATPASRAWPAKTLRLAFVIDDIGYADLVSDRLRELGLPLTGAVIPAAPYARSEAQRLHEYGLEGIIHMPMQPRDPANHAPRGQFILLDSSRAEIDALLSEAMAAVPHARGLNNHMGSLLTSEPGAMRRVLEAVKARGLFFVDSKTIPATVAYDLAREMGIRTVRRDVFLDDVQTYEHASAQIRRLVEIARQRGRALAIGHPFPSTLAALRDAVPWLKKQKVEIVPVSQILE
ncbi:MAG: divergent polysaccharide deacetylase family protein [Candidatus Aminicenantes bacterium]|nr:divergent polysaccharide deacetylase family protein [Candidatus Aminicenantes bacterium]